MGFRPWVVHVNVEKYGLSWSFKSDNDSGIIHIGEDEFVLCGLTISTDHNKTFDELVFHITAAVNKELSKME